MSHTDSLLICTACGTQFDVDDPSLLTRCRICDDPRQFVPPTGQAFTTLAQLKKEGHQNNWKQFDDDERFWSIWTEPKVAIGQRCILIKTPMGNILWDCITYLDGETIDRINGMGGLAAIVISHPHYYSTHLEWAETFDCPVYLSWEDKEWLNRLDRLGKARTFVEGKEEEIEVRGEKTGVKILKLGGHFPGSLVLLAFGHLLIADTLVTTPSGKSVHDILLHCATRAETLSSSQHPFRF
jgi:glyoxylase-like metal-dependent hydrolase (beta-lactamase superfamily II)